MRRLTSAPKPCVARLRVHLQQVARAVGAEAVADAVVAGEVARRLGGRDQVVGGDAVRRVREPHRLDRRAELAREVERRLERVQDAGLDPLAGQLLRHAEADARCRSVAVGSAHRLGQAERGRVARVGARHRAEQQRGVGGVARERARLVERRGERDHPVARDRAVGGLEADDAAQRRGLADRAAGVGPDRPRHGARPPPRRPSRPTSRRARASGPTGSASGRRRSSRSRSPSRTRPGWSSPAPARPRRRAARPRWPCTAAGSPRGSSSRPGSGCPRCRTGP